jgi:gas vesicle structural protein
MSPTESVAKEKEVVLVDLLDRIIYKGVILWGDITISVADVDLVYLGLKVLLTSVDRIEEMRRHAQMAALAGQILYDEHKPPIE